MDIIIKVEANEQHRVKYQLLSEKMFNHFLQILINHSIHHFTYLHICIRSILLHPRRRFFIHCKIKLYKLLDIDFNLCKDFHEGFIQ